MRALRTALAAGVAVALLLPGVALAHTYPPKHGETRLTTNPATQEHPDISGTKVVYEDERNGNSDIYCYDLRTGRTSRLTYEPHEQRAPQVSGTKVVYQDRRNGNSDIYVYDLSTKAESRLTRNGLNESYPRISGGRRVVYWRTRAQQYDLCCYDLVTRTESLIATLPPSRQQADISGTRIAYRDPQSIVVYDLLNKTKKRLGVGEVPRISGTTVVWARYSRLPYEDPTRADEPVLDSLWVEELRSHNLLTGVTRTVVRLESEPSYDWQELLGGYVVSGNRLFYRSLLAPDAGLRYRDLAGSSDKRLSAGEPGGADASRVVYADARAGNIDIYLYETKPAATLGRPCGTGTYPSHDRYYTVYSSLRAAAYSRDERRLAHVLPLLLGCLALQPPLFDQGIQLLDLLALQGLSRAPSLQGTLAHAGVALRRQARIVVLGVAVRDGEVAAASAVEGGVCHEHSRALRGDGAHVAPCSSWPWRHSRRRSFRCSSSRPPQRSIRRSQVRPT